MGRGIFLVKEQIWFRLFAGIFLCLLGVRAFLTKRAKTGTSAEGETSPKGGLIDNLCHLNNYSSTLLLTLSNPMSILVFVGVFAGLGIIGSGSTWANAFPLVGGVFLGSMFWCVLLSVSVGVFHKRITDNTLVLIARIFGGILTTIGIVVIIIAVA